MKTRLGPVPLLFPMPAVLVGTHNDDGSANAMTAAWSAICCMRPPCAGVAIREMRKTFGNLVAREAFTLNVARSTQAASVDYLGIVSGNREPDKLEVAGLASRRGAVVDAPILEDCPVNLECALVGKLELGTHTWFVGEIVEVHVDEALVDASGKVDTTALDPLVFCPSSRRYHRLGDEVARAFDVGKTLRRES